MTTTTALSCIACDKPMESIFGPNQPNDGVAFSTRGHYGSTVFDPMDGGAIEITVCDTCLIRARLKGQVLHHPPPQPASTPAAPTLWVDEADEMIWDLLDPLILRGETITAIKQYRHTRSCSLTEAKQAVEQRIAELVKPA